jgi:hypothetical protein
VNLLEDRLSPVAPALIMQARNIIPSMLNVNTINVFSYADATLHGNGVNTELVIDDAAIIIRMISWRLLELLVDGSG